jgi:hypothetical protein
MSFDYNNVYRAPNNLNERIEVNNNGIGLKKYGATPTSWPQYNAIQYPGVSHYQLDKTPYGFINQNANLNLYGNGLNDLFKK